MTTEQIILYGILAIFGFFYVRKQLLARGLKHYTSHEVKEKVSSGSILLDVRSSGERAMSSIPSSIHIPLHELSGRIKELERYRGKEIICYCASGNRSVSAGIKLKKAGFAVGNLKGGIVSWNF